MGFFQNLFGGGTQNGFQARNPYDRSFLEALVGQQFGIGNAQAGLSQVLAEQMMGGGPNPAQTQFMGNVQSNIANTQGLIASQRGLNPALAARMGANAAADANQKAAFQAALLQQQQQLGAAQNYGTLMNQMSGANQDYQRLYTQGELGAQGLNQKTQEGNTGRSAQLIGTLVNTAGGAGSTIATGGAKKAHGGFVEGKAKVPGDSEKNDVVHVALSPGEIVIPRSKANDPEKAKAFIDELMKDKKKKGASYGEVLEAKRKRKSA